ncbi:NlpC/P60 family protein [Oceaniglobus roseus]|uniref:C40 family peptidase n=1 Tax=Oceaniglobus roseus TaxID=1737570 RepID=UPI000C7E9EA8|nr:NlpC/P60 family protein [Kandeliimicrobium roseum]
MSDRRDTPANGRVAALHLEGQVEADRFVAADSAQVATFTAGLHAAPGGALDRQAIFGDLLDVYERRDGWAFVQGRKDGYCGYVREAALAAPVTPTHRLAVRASHIYPEAGMKQPPLHRLTFGAQLCVTDADGKWAAVRWGGGTGLVHRSHLLPLDRPMPDPAASAALFLGTPYLWGGNSDAGIDCSGLVQAACLAAHIPCPGDSDQQARTVGTLLPDDAPLQRNDLIFWKGHVALVSDPETILHANGGYMTTMYEPLADALGRIEAAEGTRPFARRRLPA